MTTSSENRVILTADAYNAMQKKLDYAMAEVYADRLGEIVGAEPGKSYGNTIVAARISQTRMFSFQHVSLSYVIVRDTRNLSGFGSDHSVDLDTSCAHVHADLRRSRECAWDTDKVFGVDGKHKLLLGELTVEAARKVANNLVDHVRDYVLASNDQEGLQYKRKEVPFMTVVAGDVIIHDGVSGQPLSKEWTGICVDGSNVRKFWYIGRSQGERSYSALAARDMRSATIESQVLIEFEKEEAEAGY